MLKIEYSPMALEDLKEISSYISINWGESVAKKIMKKITSDINKLSQYPALGVELSMVINMPTKYRYLFSGKNYIFYYIDVDRVGIVRILNEQQNYMEKLFATSVEVD